jgi:hypothetical protein
MDSWLYWIPVLAIAPTTVAMAPNIAVPVPGAAEPTASMSGPRPTRFLVSARLAGIAVWGQRSAGVAVTAKATASHTSRSIEGCRSERRAACLGSIRMHSWPIGVQSREALRLCRLPYRDVRGNFLRQTGIPSGKSKRPSSPAWRITACAQSGGERPVPILKREASTTPLCARHTWGTAAPMLAWMQCHGVWTAACCDCHAAWSCPGTMKPIVSSACACVGCLVMKATRPASFTGWIHAMERSSATG